MEGSRGGGADVIGWRGFFPEILEVAEVAHGATVRDVAGEVWPVPASRMVL